MDETLIHNPQEFDAEKLEASKGYRCLSKAEFEKLTEGADEPLIEFCEATTRIWTACTYPRYYFGKARCTYRTKMPEGYFLKAKKQREEIEAAAKCALEDAHNRVKDFTEAMLYALGALPAYKQGGETLPKDGAAWISEADIKANPHAHTAAREEPTDFPGRYGKAEFKAPEPPPFDLAKCELRNGLYWCQTRNGLEAGIVAETLKRNPSYFPALIFDKGGMLRDILHYPPSGRHPLENYRDCDLFNTPPKPRRFELVLDFFKGEGGGAHVRAVGSANLVKGHKAYLGSKRVSFDVVEGEGAEL